MIRDLGARFFDMTEAYSLRLRTLAETIADKAGFSIPQGVYICVSGPSYETPSEIKAFRTMGADLVGMSTVHEVIVARHMGIEVLGISCVTNMAAGVLNEKIHHEEVMDTGRRVQERLGNLIAACCPKLPLNPRRSSQKQMMNESSHGKIVRSFRTARLGVGGCSGSGKTSVARELARILSGTHFPLDHYYRDLSHLPPEQRSQQDFDDPEMLESDLLAKHIWGVGERGEPSTGRSMIFQPTVACSTKPSESNPAACW